jgi:hypothetical protein
MSSHKTGGNEKNKDKEGISSFIDGEISTWPKGYEAGGRRGIALGGFLIAIIMIGYVKTREDTLKMLASKNQSCNTSGSPVIKQKNNDLETIR